MNRAIAAGGLVVLVVLAGCSFPLSSGATNASRPASMTVEIVAVEDGDTYWFRNESGERVGIRLIGVDSPEIKGQNYPEEYPGIPNNESGRQWLYDWGTYVTNESRDRLVGKTVRLEFDSQLPKRDYYGRLVAYVYLNGTLLNRQLIERGHARVYPVAFERQGAFKRAERAAREDDRGLWNTTAESIP